MGDTEAPVVSTIALIPDPLIWPAPVRKCVNGRTSGLSAAILIVAGLPAFTLSGLADQRAVGGRGCLIENVALQVATLFFFWFSAVAVALMV
jgi:hypothetical protein